MTDTLTADRETVAAHLLVQRALELAGKRLLNRQLRGNFSGDLRTLHCQVPVRRDQLPRVLAGAFDWVPEVAAMLDLDPDRLQTELAEYVGSLICSGTRHDRAYLPAVLRKARG